MCLLLDVEGFTAELRDARSMAIRGLAIVMLLSCGAAPLRAGISISVGDHHLLPNAPGQFVDVQVAGSDTVSGIDLFVQVGDGGPGLADFGLPAGQPGPAIRGIDLKSGTIFAGIGDPQIDLSSPRLPQVSMQSLALIGSTLSVPAAGLLARIEVDTTGFFEGSWPLILSDVLPFADFSGPYDTELPGSTSVQILNGMLTVAPSLCDFTGDGRCDPLGDLNSNGKLDEGDLDALAKAIRGGLTQRMLDLNYDQRVDENDRRTWVEELKQTYWGDSNLDGQFDSSDIVLVFQAGQYEDGLPGNSGWASGDWSGDAEFDSGDLVLVFQEGGYNQGPGRRDGGGAGAPELAMGLVYGSALRPSPTAFAPAQQRRPQRKLPQLACAT